MNKLKLVLALFVLVSTGCHKDHTTQNCSTAAELQDIYGTTRDFYLWNTEVPSTINPSTYATPADLLDALTAQPRAEGKDRHFSYLTTKDQQTTFFDSGQNMGYGCSLGARGNQMFVLQVFPASGVATAGFQRGDEILAVSATSAGLGEPNSQASAIIAQGTLNAILDSATAGTTRYFRIRKAADGTTVEVPAATGLYGLDPVPGSAAPVILEAGAGHRVGYLMLRTFVEPASDLLRATMGAFKAGGVTDLIVDLRYDGGGRLDVAEVLLNLLRAGHGSGEVMYQMRWNDLKSANNSTALFGTEASAISPGRIAFITTGSTASASELVVNALQPYFGSSLALVGARTYGKPVGQVGYARSGCDWLLMLISGQFLNASGTGSYFGGLPDGTFTGVSCAAQDDLAHEPGDPAEACTAAALSWIATGVNPGSAIPPATEAALRRSTGALLHPQPTFAQRQIPGAY